jgi:hypothetical protein
MTYKPSPRDTMSAYVRERFGLHEDWTWVRFMRGMKDDDELPEGVVRVSGAAYPAKQRGKNKGRPDYGKPLDGTARTLFFTIDEFDAWANDREQRLGICKECQNTGEQVVSTGVDGTKYKPCTRCKATPKAQPQELFA